MRGIVAGDEDAVIALDAGDIAGRLEFVRTGDCDAIDMGIGVEHVDAEVIVVEPGTSSRRNGALVAPIDGHAGR